MKSLGVYEVKTHFSRILERVSQGETVVITKHGEPVALLKPAPGKREKPVSDTIEEIKNFVRNIP